MAEPFAKDTQYNGYSFRSRLEARWAIFFDSLNIKYLYEPEGFDLGESSYLPDFLLPDGIALYGAQERLTKVWVEIKPSTELGEDERQKMASFVKKTPKSILLLSGDPSPKADLRLISHAASGGKWSTPFVKWVELADGEVGLLKLEDLEKIEDSDIRAATEKLAGTEKLMMAYSAARKARFEHGETPAGQTVIVTRICSSCGTPFTPWQDHHSLCYRCYRAEVAGKQAPGQGQGVAQANSGSQNGRIPRWAYGLGALLGFVILLGVGFAIMTGARGVEPSDVPPVINQPALNDGSTELPTQGLEDPTTLPAAVPGRQLDSDVESDCRCSSNLYDCKDFSTQAEAQACFDLCFDDHGDVHWLDSNEDGEACETLP